MIVFLCDISGKFFAFYVAIGVCLRVREGVVHYLLFFSHIVVTGRFVDLLGE